MDGSVRVQGMVIEKHSLSYRDIYMHMRLTNNLIIIVCPVLYWMIRPAIRCVVVESPYIELIHQAIIRHISLVKLLDCRVYMTSKFTTVVLVDSKLTYI